MLKLTFVRESGVPPVQRESPPPVVVVGHRQGQPGRPLPALPAFVDRRSKRTPLPGLPELEPPETEGGHQQNTLALHVLRIASPLSLSSLPGLEPPFYSRMRDSVRTLLERLPSVTVVLIDLPPPRSPFDGEVLTQLEHVLGAYPGALVHFPDLGRPISVPPFPATRDTLRSHLSEPLLAWASAARAIGPLLRSLFQVGCLDIPPLEPRGLQSWFSAAQLGASDRVWRSLEETYGERVEEALNRIGDLDAAAFAWVGDLKRYQLHAWRSASSLGVSTLLASSQPTALAMLERLSAPLPEREGDGRSRVAELLPHAPRGLDLPPHLRLQAIPVRLLEGEGGALFESQACLRAPAGYWTLPAVRTLKEVELRIRRIAESFVFRPVDETEAMDLSRALQVGLIEYLENGVLTPLGEDIPLVRTAPEIAEGPSLVAHIEGTLRPWTRAMNVRIHLRQGELRLTSQ